MAVNANTHWECRITGPAGNLAGGGFVSGASGTDYSQQNAAQYSGTNLASANGTTNPSVITSATHNFVAADVGNIIHITAGTNWTTGWYEIVSVAANAATLDRAVGTAASLSSGTFFVGGAMSLNAATDSAFFNAMSNGNTVWMKNGAFIAGVTITAVAAGAQSTIFLKGYDTSRGDIPTGANRPTFNLGANSCTWGGWDVSNISFTGTAAGIYSSGSAGHVTNCKFVNTSTTTGRNALVLGTDSLAYNCEMISYRGSGYGGSTNCHIIGCYIHDSNVGLSHTGTTSALSIINNIIESCVTAAIQFTAANTGPNIIMGNTLYGSEAKTGIGVSLATGITDMRIIGNIIYGFTTGIVHADTQNIGYDDYNDFFNNTSNSINWTIGAHSITSSPQFTSVAQYTGTMATTSGNTLTDTSANFANVVNNQDFIYIISGSGVTVGQYLITSHTSTVLTLDLAPGTSGVADKVYQITTGRNFGVGSNMQAQGFPGTFQAGLTIGYMDIGAVQRPERVSTDPGVGNVRFGTNYTINDSSLTGIVVIPDVSDVREGVAFDTASTGTLDIDAKIKRLLTIIMADHA